MYCKYCGKEIKDGAKFCSNCGKSMEKEVERRANKEKNNKKKYIVMFVFVLVIMIIGCICVILNVQKSKKEKVKEKVKEKEVVEEEFLYTAEDFLPDIENAVNTGDTAIIKQRAEKVENFIESGELSLNKEQIAFIEHAKNMKWWVVSVKSEYSQGKCSDSFIEYDNQGKIVKSNIDFLNSSYMARINGFYEYEYLDDGRIKRSEYFTGRGSVEQENRIEYYMIDEDGYPLTVTRTDINDNVMFEGRYEYASYTTASLDGITVDNKEILINSKTGEKNEITFTGYRDRYMAKENSSSSFVDYIDKNGNIIKRVRSDKDNPVLKRDNPNSEDFDIAWYFDSCRQVDVYEYVFCTYDEYIAAKQTGDFRGYLKADFTTYLQEVEAQNQ